ncbi:putative double-stranded RNA binding motif containing protein [Lyophyllum shimeji]|uniref:Double-stranded RNA binding motif containing protein n=1 Tax=Lyophyllum shimeji TaxID=47721 RepID=A0A9P3PGX6_LYOSH|nr:putative double-stranded RNA binding motif containing protein [Lyophyllum shimeji]
MGSALPPLPKIEGDVDLVLDVYTHKSLRYEGAPLNDDYGDTDRLAELGGRILELAVTFHYYSKKPMLTAADIAELRNRALSSENLEAWLDAYGLRSKLRFAPGEKAAVGTPQEIRRFFDTYVGALHMRNGMATIQDWISRLIDPDAETAPQFPMPTPDLTPPTQQAYSPPPLQPPSSPPPLPPNTHSSNMGVPNLVSLALVNQTAVQRGIQITYHAEQVGPAHLPTWTVRCCMNGVEQGRGVGKSQKQAKEEAARQAWVRMGW